MEKEWIWRVDRRGEEETGGERGKCGQYVKEMKKIPFKSDSSHVYVLERNILLYHL